MPSWVDDLLQPGVLIPCAVILFILWLIVRSAFKAFPFVANAIEMGQQYDGLCDALLGCRRCWGVKGC